jgi:hypothetical protein
MDSRIPWPNENRSPCVWLLNPFELSRAALGRSIIFDQVERLTEIASPASRRLPAPTLRSRTRKAARGIQLPPFSSITDRRQVNLFGKRGFKTTVQYSQYG